MKRTILFFLFFSFLPLAWAEDSPYLAALKATHERFRILDAERNDYRRLKPELPPAKEEERLRLLGQLLTDDPVWELSQQIQADITALVAVRPQTPADVAIIESLKDLLACVAGFDERATTRAQAEQFATALRQFVALRDVAGASAWAKLQ
jgi:hypothetical protein